jgi:hypothetical protein
LTLTKRVNTYCREIVAGSAPLFSATYNCYST